ncbi:MAG: hypothetical protein QOI64_2773 [Solirubrobacteraceae bacterium]|nr:hypothetical protein [Solirubrobacteraceae bacterium]
MSVRRLAALPAIAAVVLLVAAEFSTVYEVTVGSLEVVKRDATGGANHGYALLVVALFAVVVTGLGLRGSARAAGLALVALGAVALVVALVVDLPDTRGSGRLPEALAYEDARARAGIALGLEIAGGVLLLAAGGLLGFGRPGRGPGGRAPGGREPRQRAPGGDSPARDQAGARERRL